MLHEPILEGRCMLTFLKRRPSEAVNVSSSELRIFVPVAIRALVDRLASRIKTGAGISLCPLIDLNPAIPERIRAGEEFDIAITNPPYAESLFAAGLADRASHRAFGRVPLAIGRFAGVEGKIAGSTEEISALFHQANSIAYTGAGTSGRTFLDTMVRLGLTEVVMSKARAMSGGEPVNSVRAGAVDLAVAPLTTVLSTSGIVPAAIFPDELGAHIDMSIFLSRTPRGAAAEVLELLTAKDLDAELAEAGVWRFKLS